MLIVNRLSGCLGWQVKLMDSFFVANFYLIWLWEECARVSLSLSLSLSLLGGSQKFKSWDSISPVWSLFPWAKQPWQGQDHDEPSWFLFHNLHPEFALITFASMVNPLRAAAGLIPTVLYGGVWSHSGLRRHVSKQQMEGYAGKGSAVQWYWHSPPFEQTICCLYLATQFKTHCSLCHSTCNMLLTRFLFLAKVSRGLVYDCQLYWTPLLRFWWLCSSMAGCQK